jgi:hypothetical protein
MASGFERKIDVGRTLQRGFETIGRHVLVYSGLAILLGGLPGFLTNYAQLHSDAASDMTFTSLYPLGGILIGWLCGSLLQATLVRSAILDLSGRPADIGGSLVVALQLILPMIGLTILSTILTGIGFILLIVPGVIAYIMLSVAVPVLVEERLGVIGSMSRSAELTEGSRWRIFGLLAIFLLFYLAAAALFGGVAYFVGADTIAGQAIVNGGLGSVVALMLAAMLASLYVELRTVKEGATTEGLAAIFD